MTDTLALESLFDDVVARFADEHTNVPNTFGWRETAKQGASPRIMWFPGDETGDAGKMAPARNPGRNPRPLATLLESFTVVIEGVDATAPTSERAQWKATRLLFDAWYRAFYLAAHGTITIEKARWIIEKKEVRYAATLAVLCTVQAEIPDEPLEIAPADATMIVDMELAPDVG